MIEASCWGYGTLDISEHPISQQCEQATTTKLAQAQQLRPV
jgi:hypothetical protein